MELIGKFDRRITIQQPDGLFNDDTGQHSGNWSDVATVWAARMSTKGKDKMLAEKTVSVGDEVFKIRYRTDIEANMRVVFKNENYEISSVEEIGRNESMRIICQRLK